MSQKIVQNPTVTFSTLAKLMGSTTSSNLLTLLRGHKYPEDGPKRSYQNAQRQVIDHFVYGTPINPTGSALRAHETEALTAFTNNGLCLPASCTARRPSTGSPKWQFHGVEISVFPDVLVQSSGSVILGGIKVNFNKDSLARGVGPSMAALLHHYLANVLSMPLIASRSCFIYEARSGAVHSCGSPTRLLASAQATCNIIAAVWPTL